MLELRTIFPYDCNDRVSDEFKTDNTHAAVSIKFDFLKENMVVPIVERITRGFPFFHHINSQINSNICWTLTSKIVLISSGSHFLVQENLISITPMNFWALNYEILPLIFIYFHQTINFIESEIYKYSHTKTIKKPTGHVCSIYFENKIVESFNIACILRKILKSLLASPVSFPSLMVSYKLTQTFSTKFCKFNKFAKDLDLNVFLTNPESLPSKCSNSLFVDSHQKYTSTKDLQIIESNIWRKLFTKRPKYREVRTVDFEKA